MRQIYAVGALAFAVFGILFAAGSAFADPPSPPIYSGEMTFPEIHGMSDPEGYSWEVDLTEGQELQSVDDQHAQVYYVEGHQPAFSIVATHAHDADGSNVPTSLNVSEGNVITLTVHHRAGDPAAGGAPFQYPVIAGDGWDGGFHTEIVLGPEDEQELREERERKAREGWQTIERAGHTSGSCLVPKLKGRKLKGLGKQLRKAHCKIGKITVRRGAIAKTGEIVKQNPKPGAVLAPGTAVNVTLGL